MEWMFLPLRRYADFQGRSRRREYWMFALGTAIIYTAIVLLLGGGDDNLGTTVLVFGLFTLGIIVPSVAVQVRRFHDQDRSGWFVLLNFIPYIGSLIVLVFMCLEGTRGENRFGPDPLG